MPVSRTIFAFKVSEPLVPVHDNPVGGGGGGVLAVTVTVADWLALPPVPVQFSVYVLFVVMVSMDTVPWVAMEPDQDPDAVQAVALVEDQVSIESPPLWTELGLALSDTVGLLPAALPVMVMTAEAGEPKSAPCGWAI
jgi:hypothetical protein